MPALPLQQQMELTLALVRAGAPLDGLWWASMQAASFQRLGLEGSTLIGDVLCAMAMVSSPPALDWLDRALTRVGCERLVR